MFFDTFHNRLTIEGTLAAQTAMRIGAGRATEPVGTDLPVVRDGQGRPFIPGSSLKGVIRTTAEQIARAAAGPSGACLPTGDDEDQCITKSMLAEAQKQAAKERWNDEHWANWYWDHSCLTCQTFGSTRLASHVKVKDLAVDQITWFDQFQVRDGVAIDRDKGTVAEKKLYDYEVVPAGVGFKLEIVVENAEEWQWGMVWLSLQPFLAGNGAVGGFTSRGLGWTKLEGPKLILVEPNGNPGALLDALLGQVASLSGEQMKEKTRAWLTAFRAKLVEEA
jgi:CRISPR-associated RAMP protein (TIGR02581 family)